MPVGHYLGQQLALSGQEWVLVPLGMLIGYFLVTAEPAVHVLNRQVEEVSAGAISARAMGISLSIAVSAAMGLSMLRVLTGLPVLWLLLPGYAAALALSVVVMLAAFFGFGSAKLRGKYNTARQWFTAGVAADNGYNLSEELTTRMNTAANVITTASNTLGADNAEVLTAQDALTAFSNDLDGVKAGKTRLHALYEDNETLGTAIDQLYAKLQEQAADPMKMGAVQGQYGQFNSAATIIGTLQYNTAVYEYQKDVGGFPASVLGALSGVKEVEPFA